MSEQPAEAPRGREARLTITVPLDGLEPPLVSMKSEGEHSGPVIDNRFYSLRNMPPDDIQPATFWGTLLRGISDFLLSG